MFDVVNKCWSKEILDQLEIDESRLPKSFKPGSLIGNVNKNASQETGLKRERQFLLRGETDS